jgi:hypothetical protein
MKATSATLMDVPPPKGKFEVRRSNDRDEIERQWRIGGSVIPAMVCSESSALYSLPIVPGRGRTRYFYRKMAIRLFQDSRQCEWFKGQRATFLSLAKSYLASYRKLCATERGRS